MKHWVYPANLKLYDVIGAFTNEPYTGWPMTSKVSVDDVVFIYCGAPLKQICFKCVVSEIDIPAESIADQAEKYIKVEGKSPKRRFMLLKVSDSFDISKNSPLSFSILKNNGLKGSIMGPQCLENNPQLFEYIKALT